MTDMIKRWIQQQAGTWKSPIRYVPVEFGNFRVTARKWHPAYWFLAATRRDWHEVL